MKTLVLLGAPGSGKGTQSAKLIDEKGYSHVSTGNLLRAEVEKATELGKEIKTVMESGSLVSDELVVRLLKSNIDLDSGSYIFDGYPRNIDQAKTLDSEILGGRDYLAIYFDIDNEKLVERLTNRRVTKDGKNIYNLLTNPPIVPGKCDETGQDLIQRDDDKEDVIRNRMKIYNDTIGPVLDFYREKGILKEIQADNDPEDIFGELEKLV
jgi:adenylate kinase